VLEEEELAQVVLPLWEILLGILHLQEILLVVLPLVAIPIQMEFGVDCLFSLLCSGGPLNLVLLCGIEPRHCRQHALFAD
jgi:hypothetical protein